MDQIATKPLRSLPLATDNELEQRLLLLMSTLPQANSGGLDGVLKVEGYLLVLRGKEMPLLQLDWAVQQALHQCEWMPSPAKLAAIAAEWQRSDEAVQARAKAEVIARREREQRLEDARQSLRNGTMAQLAIDALPERFAAILETQGLLHRCPDCGTYTARPQASLTVDAPADLSELRAAMAAKHPSNR